MVAGSGSGVVDAGDGEVVVGAVGVVDEVGVGRWLGLSGIHGCAEREKWQWTRSYGEWLAVDPFSPNFGRPTRSYQTFYQWPAQSHPAARPSCSHTALRRCVAESHSARVCIASRPVLIAQIACAIRRMRRACFACRVSGVRRMP